MATQITTTTSGNPNVDNLIFGGEAMDEWVNRELEKWLNENIGPDKGILGFARKEAAPQIRQMLEEQYKNKFATSNQGSFDCGKGLIGSMLESFNKGNFAAIPGTESHQLERDALSSVAGGRDHFLPIAADAFKSFTSGYSPSIDKTPFLNAPQVDTSPYQNIDVDLSGRFDRLADKIQQRVGSQSNLSGNFGSSLAQQALTDELGGLARDVAIDDAQLNAGLQMQNRGLLAGLDQFNVGADLQNRGLLADLDRINIGTQMGHRGQQLQAAGALSSLDAEGTNNMLARGDAATRLRQLSEAAQLPEYEAFRRLTSLVAPVMHGGTVTTTQSTPLHRNRTAGVLGGALSGFAAGGPLGGFIGGIGGLL